MASNRDREGYRGDVDPISMVEDIERNFKDEPPEGSELIRRIRDRERGRDSERDMERNRQRPDPRRPEPSGERKGRDVPPSAPETPQGAPQGQGRIAYYRSLQGFLQAVVEAAPLYMGERRRNPHMSEEELREHVAARCKDHLGLIDLCLKANNANTQDILLRYIRRAMAKNIAAMYKDSPIEDLEGLVEIARDWILENNEFENALAENASSDNILGVKLALFTASLSAYQKLDGLWCGHEPKEVIKQLERLAIDLCKDVSFSWSKRSQISDRENLFSTLLPYCLEVLEGAYRQFVMEELDPIEYLPSDPGMPLPLFEAVFEEMDMGYEEDEADKLVGRIRSLAKGYLDNAKLPHLTPDDNARWKSNFLAHFDGILAQSWNEAGSSLIEELGGMSEEEREIYLEEHQVMDFSRFDDCLKNNLSAAEAPFSDITISFEQVMDRAKHDMAWIWGISDSLITARKEQLPED